MQKSVSICLLIVMLISLAGCGGAGEAALSPALSGGDTGTGAPAPAVMEAADADPMEMQQSLAGAYTAQTIFEAEGTMLWYVAAGAGQIYLYAETVPDSEGRTHHTLYILDETGAELDRFSLEPPEGSLAAMTFDGSALWLATEVWSGQTLSGGQICRFDPALGQITDSFGYDGTDMTSDVRGLFASGSRLYLCTGEDVRVWSYEGEELFRAVPDQLGDPSWAMTADGCLAAAGDFQDRGSRIQLLDTAGQSFGPPIECAEAQFLLDGDGSYDLYCRDFDQLYGLDLDAGTVTPVLNWTDAGVLDMNGAAALGDGRFLVMSAALQLLEPWQGEGDGPQTVTVATLDPAILEYAVVEFNNSQTQYKAVLKDYSQYDNGLERLGLDIASGAGPDVFDLRGLPVEQYVRRGYLEDIYPYLDADPDLSREDMDQTMLRAMETDGALYELIPQAELVTLQMPQERLDRMGTLSWSGILAAAGGADPFYMTGRESLLAYAVCGPDSPFLDWGGARCDFDNGEFRALLTLAARMESEPGEAAWDAGAQAQAVRAGDIFVTLSLSGETGFVLAMNSEALGTNEVPLAQPGLPGRSGPRYLLESASLDLGIAAAGQNRDGAWAFLRSALDFICRGDGDMKLVGENTPLFEEEAHYPRVNGEEGYMAAETAVFSAAAAQAVEKASGVFHRDENIMDIIMDEAAALFAGDPGVTPEAVASAIQSRASLYMAEQS